MKNEASGYFKDLLTSRANNLLEHQTVVAAMSYNSRSGELLRSVQQSPSLNGASDAELTLEYPLYIRFLDMKKGRGGRKKKVYEPIYNRYIWGYLFTVYGPSERPDRTYKHDRSPRYRRGSDRYPLIFY